MKLAFQISLLALSLTSTKAFSVVRPGSSQGRSAAAFVSSQQRSHFAPLYLSSESEKAESAIVEAEFQSLTEEKKKEAVGNLVADDEWNGLAMELSDIVRLAVVEDIKKKTSDFIGKDDYNTGDISKEVDSRVKKEIAALRGKDGRWCCTT